MVEVFKDARKKAYLNAEGADKPACVAETMTLVLGESPGKDRS